MKQIKNRKASDKYQKGLKAKVNQLNEKFDKLTKRNIRLQTKYDGMNKVIEMLENLISIRSKEKQKCPFACHDL